MTVAVITILHGRHDHLALQRAGLARSSRRPDMHVVVAMDDPGLEQELANEASGPLRVLHVPRVDGHLPLARARNLGAQSAIADGATVLIFLDVDCVPSPELVEAYEEAATHSITCRDLLSGPVTYLPPPPAGGYDLGTLASLAEPHPARPLPDPGSVERTRHGYDLFWSLSFALSAETWFDIGGFDEAYLGYGAEDTDFARRAETAGTALAWVGDAQAYHQHHPVTTPPVEHVEDIVRNATLFQERWGEWPMRGWLDAFESRGLVRRTSTGALEVADPDTISSPPLEGTR